MTQSPQADINTAFAHIERAKDNAGSVMLVIQELEKAEDCLTRYDAARKWQKIETAPKDGEWIMVYWPTMGIGMFPFVVFWDEGWEPASHYARDYGTVHPTHWMPLPAAPTEAA